MKYKLIFLVSALMLLLCLVSCRNTESVSELEFTSNGDGTCYVSGYENSLLPTEIEIPSLSPNGDTVTAIGDCAFLNRADISKLTIPETVTSLGEYSLSGCDSLKSISIPASATDISNTAFMYSHSLAEIKVAEGNPSYKDIDGNLYNHDGTTFIQYAIGKNDKSFVIPNGVISIGDNAFADCDFLESVTISHSVTNVTAQAFSGCDSLVNIGAADGNSVYGSMDGNLCTLDGTTFVCYAPGKTDSSFEIPEGITAIAESAFCGCTALKIITVPESVTIISSGAFNSSGVKRVVFADGTKLETIGANTFAGCIYLTEISIPSGVAKIGESAFMDCESLVEVSIPSSVTEISAGAFFGCDSLTDVYYTGTEAEWAAISTGAGNEYLTEANIHYNYAE